MTRLRTQVARRIHKLILASFSAVLVASLLLPASAQAWKPTTHVYLANIALADALDDGKVTINRVDYMSGKILDEIGTYQVDSTTLAALRSNSAQYHAGILGPDAYPDILTGQQVIHPSPADTGIQGGANAWLQYLWDRAQQAPDNTPAVRAFVTGYLTHAAGDMFGHTFINNFSGAPFEIKPPAGPLNAIKHVIVEGYVDKRLPSDVLNAAFFDASIDGVDDFIYRNMVDARPGSQLDRQLLTRASSATDLSVPRIYSTLRAALQQNIDTYYETKADYQSRIDDCGWFDFSCSNAVLGVRLAAYVATNAAQVTYQEAWRDDIDAGLRAWPGVSHQVAEALFFNPARTADTEKADEILQKYALEHLLAMSGSPDFVGISAATISSVIDAITPDFLLEPIRQLKQDMLNTLLKAAIGMTKDELQKYLTSPDKYFDEVMGSGAGENVSLRQFNADYLKIDDPGYLVPAESFDYRNMPAAYNTATMSKLILLGPDEVNRLLRDLGSTRTLTVPNAMLGFIETLDGDNQWGNGMALAQDCRVYTQIFMRQPGETGLPDCVDAPAQPAAAGTLLSLQSANYPGLFVRHKDYGGRIDPIVTDLDKQTSTFRLVGGLANSDDVSLEAANLPGYYLVVEGSAIMLRPRTPNDAQFDLNATFVQRPGLSDPALISFESLAQPGKYVRHSSYMLFAHAPDDSDLFKKDASFTQMPPNWTP